MESVISLRMETELVEQLRDIARQHDRTLSAEVRRAVKLYLASIERQRERGGQPLEIRAR